MTLDQAIESANRQGHCKVRADLWVWRADALRLHLEVQGKHPYFVISDRLPQPAGVRGANDPKFSKLLLKTVCDKNPTI